MNTERPIAIARPSATILLLREDVFEVLMIRRHHEQVFASALVFPGGLIDDSDRSDEWLPLLVGGEGLNHEQRALRIAAFRETFEETSILLARDEAGSHLPSCSAADHPSFLELVATAGGKLWLDDLAHFGHWITPERAPKRFDTHFFLAVAPQGHEPCCDGIESMAFEWIDPVVMSDRERADENGILFPTRMNLSLLARSPGTTAAIAESRNRSVFTVRPRAEKREGGMAIVIPAEAGYGETENFHPRG